LDIGKVCANAVLLQNETKRLLLFAQSHNFGFYFETMFYFEQGIN
jgi:hypothetical protein